MSSNYPAGSMRGSGIYSDTIVLDVECDELLEEADECCKFAGEVDVVFDDFGRGYWICPTCSAEHEVDADDMNERDPDEAYERMRDERDGIW